jgi:hypothetical protein
MKKVFTFGFFAFLFGIIAVATSLGVGSVGADSTYVDPSADIFRILLWIGGAFLVLGVIMVASASITMKR